MSSIQALIGIFVLIGVAWAVSESRRKIKPQQILLGIGLQAGIAFLLLKVPGLRDWVQVANRIVGALERATTEATSFMFGYLAGAPLPFQETVPGASFIVAFRVLPLVIVVSALTSLLFYWRILPLVVRALAFVLQKTLRISGPSGLGAAADVFLGIAEAPLFVRPYLASMTRTELFTVMTCGMASVAGTVMVLYASILGPGLPDAIGHLVVASVITIPAAIVFAHIMVPESRASELPTGTWDVPQTADSSMDAIVRGTLDGVQMLLGIIAMIIVIFALVHLINGGLSLFGEFSGAQITLQRILSWVLFPVVWLMGVPATEAEVAARLFGSKIVLNEFVAYMEMAKLPESTLSAHSRLIMTYGMCGFANLASLGILIGGLTSIIPQRKKEILALGFRSLVAGNLATALTGALVGLIL